MTPGVPSEYFLFIASDTRLRMTPLPAGGVLTVGRSTRNDIRLSDRLVSAHHALLAVGPELTITDLGSKNGTRVATQSIPPLQTTVVQPGEAVQVGDTVLIIETGPPGEAHAAGG
jgi:pSer/pThr/pTyr-binding forkhead associated (FHA) protein